MCNFPTWTLDVDYSAPQLSRNALAAITDEVEQCSCTAGKSFHLDGVSEGVVWTGMCSGTTVLRFKAKGRQHSVSKLRTLARVGTERVRAFVEYAVTEARMAQGLRQVVGHRQPMMHEMNAFVRRICADVHKEEAHTLAASNLTMHAVSKAMCVRARKWFVDQLCAA